MAAPATTHPTQEAATTVLAWILRAGVAACYIGHGMLGINRVAAWTSYFAVVGIGKETAFALMPWVGVLDVALALTALFYPARWLVLYMIAWCVWTALLRPLAGESIWEAVERAGNYGAPLALLLLMPAVGATPWRSTNFFTTLDDVPRRWLGWALQGTTALLLLGHGALHVFVRKPLFIAHYEAIGLPGASLAPFVGIFECLLALAVLLRPRRALLLGVVGWKLVTEVLNPVAGSPIWVFIEHGGSYAAPLALAFLLQRFPRNVPRPALFPAT